MNQFRLLLLILHFMEGNSSVKLFIMSSHISHRARSFFEHPRVFTVRFCWTKCMAKQTFWNWAAWNFCCTKCMAKLTFWNKQKKHDPPPSLTRARAAVSCMYSRLAHMYSLQLGLVFRYQTQFSWYSMQFLRCSMPFERYSWFLWFPTPLLKLPTQF